MFEFSFSPLEKHLYLGLAVIATCILGTLLGIGIAMTKNINIIEPTTREEAALPTQILDRNDRLITTFFSNENRTLLDFAQIPRIIMLTLITREDKTYLVHHGFSFRGTSRALFNIATGQFFSGGSTITQQIAGTLYANRREKSITRKLKELWWALQLERSWSKQEIITEYLNKVYFGHGNYGVETSSQYFFNHSAKTINAAESVMLVIQLANPTKYSPLKNPNTARKRQKEILDQMVALNFIPSGNADLEFQNYWNNYDFTRASVSSAFLEREDKAPFFSEYIRGLLINELGFTSEDINTGGLVIHTTLDLDAQLAARGYFDEGLAKANRIYRANSKRLDNRQNNLFPIASLATLFFDDVGQQLFNQIRLKENASKEYFNLNIQPIIAMSHLLFEGNANTLNANIAFESKEYGRITSEEETVEGALITLDNRNGYIVAMIGGSKFDGTNQFNRAVSAFVQPGSAFKPLYYAAAIEDKIITPSTILWDSPVVFTTDDGEAYVPRNYKGEWKGPVTVRTALSNSMNVPSLKVLNKVGFDRALEVSSSLLDLPREEWANAGLVKKYPVGLGIVSVSPFSMVKAYATIANLGRKVEPIAIRYIEDRNGTIIHKTEQKIRANANISKVQIISPQAAYIMQSLLQSTVQNGTLAHARYQAGGFTQPTGGKTGTTQNWSDAWTLGFTPYYTTALWYGFDRGGQSLGTNQTGAITAGPVWGKYMESINKELPVGEFPKPQGIITVVINPKNNKLAADNSPYKKTEVFIADTVPQERDNPNENAFQAEKFQSQLESSTWNLHIPTQSATDEDAFFDFYSQEELQDSNATEDKENTNTTQNKSIRLRLDVPSSRKLKSDEEINTTEDKKNTNTNPFLN